MKLQKNIHLLGVAVLMSCILIQYSYGQDTNIRKGVINGRVIDAETKTPLVGANVMIASTQMGASTDAEGNFVIHNVPVGNHTLTFSYIGYEPFSKTDVIVKPERIITVHVGLRMSSIAVEGVTVIPEYFAKEYNQPLSISNFSSEEIRRAPGSAGDVSRIVMVLPSVAKIDDQSNSLIVRGGSPTENTFFVDNIEIPNVNHYPTQGSSGGPIGLLHTDFIQDVSFYTGGFSAAYGDRLSSVMDLTFREGNRDELDGQVDLHFAGFGLIAEGPIVTGKGSWLLSARRSFLDLLVDAIGTGVAPRYSDYQGKLVYDLGANNTIMALGIRGIDYIGFTKEEALEQSNSAYGTVDIMEYTTGLNWQWIWNENGYSNTSLSHIATEYESYFTETRTDNELLNNNSIERFINLRNVNFYRFNESMKVAFGFGSKYIIDDYDHYFAEYTDILGDTIPSLSIDDRITAYKIGAYTNFIWTLFSRLTTTTGVRADYFSYNENTHFSPRFALSYRVTDKTAFNAATGIYYQSLPMILLSQNDNHKLLKDPVAYHVVAGIEHLFTQDTRITLEVYNKQYENLPLDPTQPPLFILDELSYSYGFYFNHEELRDVGEAYSRGVELTIQKKLATKLYGLVCGSYSTTQYKDYHNTWRERIYDNRYIFSIEGGYKPSNTWEFSLRWIFAGGAPYTPFDTTASEILYRAVIDQNRVNEVRYPDYHSLNVRLDKRFHFSRSNLIIYFSIWNAYNRKNVAGYYWDEMENEPGVSYQWSMLPIFGLEYEF